MNHRRLLGYRRHASTRHASYPPEYPGYFEVRRVSNAGEFIINGCHRFLSQALKGEYIGLEAVEDGIWNIIYYTTLLGRLDECTGQVTGASYRSEKCK